ncbi:MAG TPA: hypothetical protein VNO24_10650 [Blastocatellia bacterium]|nr:hypothetical protein [Blastocatellia bacterium]
MRKIGFVLALIVLLAGVSVQAQKSPKPLFVPPTVEPTTIVVQDDNAGGYLVFDPVSGAYKCNLCEYGYVLSGIGQVKVDGCNVYFSDIQGNYRMFASLNMCEHQAKAAIEVFALPTVGFVFEPILEYWTDTDMLGNTTECVAATIKPAK